MSAEAFAEVIGNPYKIYVAPVGTSAPAIDDDESAFTGGSGDWVLLGTNGIDNQGSDGVTISLGETVQNFTPAGRTLPVKGWRTEEQMTVAFSLVDTSIEQVSKFLDDAAITTVAPASGVAGEKSVKLERGISMKYQALLARGLSPYDDGSGLFFAQYEFTRVYQAGTPSVKYSKGVPAELAFEFMVCGDVAGNDPALYRAQTDAASS